jgi:preprotein translocase subunit SecD
MERVPLAALAAALLLTSCSDDKGGDPGAGDAPVEFRRVITSSQLDGACRAGASVCEAWGGFRCPGEPQQLEDGVLMACGTGDETDQPYLLSEPDFVGGVESAVALRRERIDQWEVEIELDAEATDAFADLTAALVPTYAQLAIVLDDTVLSAPAVQTPVTDGAIRLAGDYTEAEAESLADKLAR